MDDEHLSVLALMTEHGQEEDQRVILCTKISMDHPSRKTIEHPLLSSVDEDVAIVVNVGFDQLEHDRVDKSVELQAEVIIDSVHRVVPLKDSDKVIIQALLQEMFYIRLVDLNQFHYHSYDVEHKTAVSVLNRS